MPISALVLKLSDEPGERQRAVLALGEDPRLLLGALIGSRLPVVAETDSLQGGEALSEQLRETEGVHLVDVISVDFSDLEA
jgi:hypothetical protein